MVMPPSRFVPPGGTPRERFIRAYRFFREYGNTRVGHAAEQAIALARAEQAADEAGLVLAIEDDPEPWDAECERPEWVFVLSVVRREEPRDVLACLGSVGVNDRDDPYLRVCRAELFAEALVTLANRGAPAKGGPTVQCDPEYRDWPVLECAGTWPNPEEGP